MGWSFYTYFMLFKITFLYLKSHLLHIIYSAKI
nr:MAG TPA: hypothetical protein [Caudoviricetes sp.]